MEKQRLAARAKGGISLLAVMGAVVVAPLAGTGTAHADPVDEQRAKVEQYADMLEDLEEETYRLAEQYDIALDELSDLEADVEEAEEAVAAKQEEVSNLQAQLGEVAVQSFTTAGSSGIGIFQEPGALNAELQREALTRVAMNTGTADADALETAVNELEEQEDSLEDQRDAAERKAEEVAAAQEAAEEQAAAYEDAKAEAERELGERIREEQERRAKEAYERMQAEAAAAQARAEAAAAQAQQQQQQQSNNNAAGGGGNTSSGGGGGNTSSGGGGGGGGGAPAPAAPAPAPAAPAPIPAASSRAGTAVNAAMSQQGVPYKFAAASPGVAFDCSGLTAWAWGQAGVGLPHQSAQQYASIPHVPASAAQPGDLIFYYSPISHVGIYIGGGQLVHATSPGNPVTVGTVNWGNVTGVGRPG